MAQGKPQNFGEVLAQAGSDGLNFMAANYLPQQQQQKNNAMSALAMMMKVQDAEREKQMHSLLLTKHQKDIQMAGLKMLQANKELARDPAKEYEDKKRVEVGIAQEYGGMPSWFESSTPALPDLTKFEEFANTANELNNSGLFKGEAYPTITGGKIGIGYAKPPVSNAAAMNDLPEHATVRVQELSRRRSQIYGQHRNTLTGKVNLPISAEMSIAIIDLENDIITKAITPEQVRAKLETFEAPEGLTPEQVKKYKSDVEALIARYSNK